MAGFAFELACEVALVTVAKGWVVDDAVVFGSVEVLEGHRAWPRMLGLDSGSGAEVVLPEEGDLQVERLRKPLLSFYGRECSDYGGEVSAVLEVSLRSPWALGAEGHAYLMDGVREFASAAREEFLVQDLAVAGVTPGGWGIYGCSWNGEDGRARWDNSFDGWHWVMTGELTLKGAKGV